MLAGATVFWGIGHQFSGWIWVDVVADDSGVGCADSAGRDRGALGAGGRAWFDDGGAGEDKSEVRSEIAEVKIVRAGFVMVRHDGVYVRKIPSS